MRETIVTKGITWELLTEPNNSELVAFVRNSQILPADAEFIASEQGRSEITIREDYILVLIHIPVFDKKLRVTSGVPVYFIAMPHKLYCICYRPVVALQKITKAFEEAPERQAVLFGDDAVSLMLHVIGQLNDSSFRKLHRLMKHITIAEDAVFQGNERKMVEEIAILARDVLDFRSVIRPHIKLFDRSPEKLFSTDTRVQWRRVAGQYTQLWEILESLHDNSKELRETNDSLLQHKENELLRMLSYYSIIAIPVWIFVTPYDPREADATLLDAMIFYGVLGLLCLLLGLIVLRGRRRRVL